MTKKLLLLFFLYSAAIWAQKSQKAVDLYTKTINETAAQDPTRALKIADSLTKTATTPELEGKAYLLSANIYLIQYKYEESIKNGEKAKEILSTTDNYELQSTTLALLAQTYGYSGLLDKAEKYLKEGVSTSNKIKDPVKKASIKARLCTELSNWAYSFEKYDKAIEYHFEALQYLSKISTDSMNVGHHYQQIGTIYFNTKRYKQAKPYFLKAIQFLPEGTKNMALAKNGLGEVLLEEKKYDEAEKIFLETFEFAGKSKNAGMKKLASECLADLYEKTKQYQKASFYRKLQGHNNAYIQKNAINFIGKNLNETEKEKEQYASLNSTKNIVISVSSLLILALLIIFLINRKKHKEEYKKFKSIINHYKEKEEYVLETKVDTSDIEESKIEEDIVSEDIEANNKQNEIAINKETETKILEQLNQFEKEEMYNNSYISLSFLATEFNTNIRYISYVVKKHKNADFKSYINKLRINYIIHKLNTSEKYRKYKVSALAEECGFSSHSKFTTIFKSITGISPSSFISFVEQEEAKKKGMA